VEERFKNICGVVLAGGKCSRYEGKNKAFLEIEEETFYDKSLRILGNIFEDIIVITNCTDGFPDDKIPKYADIIKDIGPLGGIHSALSNSKDAKAIFIIASDMPCINEDIIREMTKTFLKQKVDILIPRIDNNLEPLFAIYSKKILLSLNDYLKTTKVFSIRSFFKKANTAYFDIEATEKNRQAFLNINSQNDYDKFIRPSDNLK